MKLRLLLAIVCSSMGMACQAAPYVAVHAGASYTDIHSNEMNWGSDDSGAAIPSDNFGGKSKVVGAGSVAVGYDFADQMPIRVELEYTLRGDAKGNLTTNSSLIDDDTGKAVGSITNKLKARAQTALVNVYWDINTGTSFTPFVTGGIGMAHAKLTSQFKGSDEKRSDSDNNFAWAVGAGASYKFDKNWSADLMARYYDAGEVKAYDQNHETYAKGEIRGVDMLMGVRYSF
ncbi:porin family protein [Salmonella enterica]|nr:porin family protein [Salmonella enterica]EDW0581175.1 porin family protein [Salmonella enterica subsp. enterica serovar Poona]EBD0565605.1 porin family protein [Salmonella enterica]EBD1344404.1 porin family protein [Salmonella enterica]EBI2534971.1 porin family protein [Salmonella enterica]